VYFFSDPFSPSHDIYIADRGTNIKHGGFGDTSGCRVAHANSGDSNFDRGPVDERVDLGDSHNRATCDFNTHGNSFDYSIDDRITDHGANDRDADNQRINYDAGYEYRNYRNIDLRNGDRDYHDAITDRHGKLVTLLQGLGFLFMPFRAF
jgi:hypothetical protein